MKMPMHKISRNGIQPVRNDRFANGLIQFLVFAFFAPLIAFAAPAAEVSVYGPEQFTRDTGKPVQRQASVAVANTLIPYRLKLINGGSNASDTGGVFVSSAKIDWNGAPVAGPDDFNQNVAELTLPVSAQAANILSVELEGKPGGSIAVELLRDNQAPAANAGADQTVFTGGAAVLDGSASGDADGDPLSYLWRLAEIPPGSAAQLDNPAAVRPSFSVDRPGHYRLELTVNDGFADSAADSVAIDTRNSAPVADAGADQSVFVSAEALLDGGLSHDADGDPLNYAWTLAEKPAASQAVIIDDRQQQCRLIVDKPGRYLAQLIVNDGEADSEPDTVAIDTRNSAPVADAGDDKSVFAGDTLQLDGSRSRDADGDALTYAWSLNAKPDGSQAMLVGSDGITPHLTPDLPGLYIAQLIVSDFESASQPDTAAIEAQARPSNRPPAIDSEPATQATAGQPYVYAVHAEDSDGDTLSYSLTGAPAGMSIGADGVIAWTPPTAGDYAVIVAVEDGRGGSDSQSFSIAVAAAPAAGDLPPDPASVAPPLDRTALTPLAEQTEFLYTGPNPIQTGVAQGTIQTLYAAVIRGRVLNRDGTPLSGATVSIKDHPEYGQTLSRADGWFDLAVNGGGLLTVDYAKTGYLPAQRQVTAPWRDYVIAEDAALIALDSKVNAIDLGDTSRTFQVAQGSVMSDADGERQATVLFPQGTAATMTLPDGTKQALSALNVRASEYTVGENGPKAMPGALPPTSGYTYAVELNADEAIAAGAARVDFSQALPVYVDNFLNFPIGETVPVGWYDRTKAAWIPSDNGKVIKILAVNNGQAEVDSDGDGIADSADTLAALGITVEEQTQLAALYPAGKSLWRVLVKHFTPWDCNWPYGPPQDAEAPPPSSEESQKPPPDEDSDECDGCSINPQAQTLGEEIPLAGTPFKLHYQSRRAEGYKAGRIIDIPLSDASIPASLLGIDLNVTVAGQTFTQSFPPAPNQSYTFEWDGLDAYGRQLSGEAEATVTVAYRYNEVYYPAINNVSQSFATASSMPGSTAIGERNAAVISLDDVWTVNLSSQIPLSAALGEWSMDIHHQYDAASRVLHQGDGSKRVADDANKIIETVAGTGVAGNSGDGGPATEAQLWRPETVAAAPNGNVYVAYRMTDGSGLGVVRKLAADGTISTALSHPDFYPRDVALGADGSLYFADDASRVRRLGPDGAFTTVAGAGYTGFSGDSGPATAAQLYRPQGIALGPDGSIYIADTYNNRIRKIGPDGIINTVAGNGIRGFSGDGGPATTAGLYYPYDIALGPDGSLYIADWNARVRKVGTDGIITTVAGYGTWGSTGDGGLATSAAVVPMKLAFGPDGSLYVLEPYNRVRRIMPDGTIRAVAGTEKSGFSGDGGPATAAQLRAPTGIAIDPKGILYIADLGNQRVRAIVPILPGFADTDIAIPSEDGNQLYRFDADGRHLDTRDTITQAILYRFTYDSEGRLSEIADVDNNLTRIERDTEGNPTAIIAPDDLRTALTLNAAGTLAAVANPAGETYQMEYTSNGLLTRFTDPKNQSNAFEYDAEGRLVKDTDAAGGGWTIARSETSSGYSVTMTTAEGHSSSFSVEPQSTGDRKQVNTAPDGTHSETLYKTTGETVATSADGTVTTTVEGPDPRFGMLAPLQTSVTVKLPSGLTSTAGQSRSATLTDKYDPLSLTALTETWTVNGNAYRADYSAATNAWTATSAENRTATTQLNAQGRPILKTLPGLEPIAYSYDAKGRIAAVAQGQNADTRTVTYRHYDRTDAASGALNGYLESVTDAQNRTTAYRYDATGRITAQIHSTSSGQVLPDAREIYFDYDANGNLTGVTPPGRPAHGFSHTPVDLIEQYDPPAVADVAQPQTRYSYNRDKQPTLIQRPDGQQIEFLYNAASGKLDLLRTPGGDTTQAYDAASGKLKTVTTPDGNALSYRYDGSLATGRTWSGAVNGQVDFSYNSDFRVTSVKVDNADPVSYAYDRDGLITQAGSLALSRNAQNGLLTGTALGTVTDAYSYNGFGETVNYQAFVGANSFAQWSYQRDNLGRIAQKTETVNGIAYVYDYAYDQARRLIEVKQNGSVQATYGYDVNGNRTQIDGQTIAQYDDQDRLIAYNPSPAAGGGAGERAFEYSANGELKTKTENGQITQYDYDVFGNLKHVTLSNGANLDYVVDGQNRRIGKKVNGQLIQGFLYQNQINPIAELDGNGQVVARFVYGDKGNVPAYIIKGTQTYRIISDHLGSPRLIVNSADGSVMQKMEHDVWGNVTQDTNPGFQPFGFAGGIYDRDTKLVRFGARDYDAETGRWTAKDPIGFAGGDANLYGYVLNNPVNWVDPLGLTKNDVCAARALAADAYPQYAFPRDYGFADMPGIAGKTLPQVGTILNSSYLNKLSNTQAADLLNTIIHEAVHYSLPPDSEYQQDKNETGFPYDEADELTTPELVNQLNKDRKSICMCQ